MKVLAFIQANRYLQLDAVNHVLSYLWTKNRRLKFAQLAELIIDICTMVLKK